MAMMPHGIRAGVKLFQVNVFESANIVRESVNHFLTRGGGIVISLSSWSGQKGSALPTLPAYAAFKGRGQSNDPDCGIKFMPKQGFTPTSSRLESLKLGWLILQQSFVVAKRR